MLCMLTWYACAEQINTDTVKSGSDPHGTPNADGSGVRGAESNMGVGSDGEHVEGMSMDARIHLRVNEHAGGP